MRHPTSAWTRRAAWAALAWLSLASAASAAPNDFFQYDQAPVVATVSSVIETPEARVTTLSFPSPVKSGIPQNDIVSCWFFLPHASAPVPAVVVLHEWGTKRATRARALADALAQRGVAGLVMTLPYHMTRTLARSPSGRAMLTGDPYQVLANMRQAVLDVRRAVDWLQQQPQVDGRRLGIAGISLGAVIGDLALGVEPRLSAGASLLGAGDVADLYWHSPLLWQRQREAKRRGFTHEQIAQLFAPIEPTTYAHRLRPDQVLMINAMHDFVYPKHAVLDLWEAFGRPRLLWLDSGHYGAFLAQRQVLREAADFLAARLRVPPQSPALAPPRVPVRLRAGIFVVDRDGVTPGLSFGLLRWGARGQLSVEVIVDRSKPLLSVAVAPAEYIVIGWGTPFTGGRARGYLGVFATF